MAEIKTLFDTASAVDSERVTLHEAVDTLELLVENMEREGYQTEEQFEEWKAVIFGYRFPLYHSALRSVIRDLRGLVSDLDTSVNAIYKAHGTKNT